MTDAPHPMTFWPETGWDDPAQRTGANGLGFTIIRGHERIEVKAELEQRLPPRPTDDDFRQYLRHLSKLFLEAAGEQSPIFRHPPAP